MPPAGALVALKSVDLRADTHGMAQGTSTQRRRSVDGFVGRRAEHWLTERTAWALLALFAGGAAALAFLGDHIVSPVIATMAALLAAGVPIWRGVSCRGGLRRAWLAIGVGMMMNSAGDIVWAVYDLRGREPPLLSGADLPYLATYVLVLAGVCGLVRVRARGALGDVFADAANVATVAGLAIWQFFVVNPGIAAHGSYIERVIRAAYPLCGTLLVAALVILLTAPTRADASTKLIGGFIGGFLMADVLFALVRSSGSSTLMALSDAAYLIPYGLMAAAAAHPSSAQPTAGPARDEHLGHRLRVVLLGAGLVGTPTLAILTAAFGFNVQAPVYVCASLAVSLLVLQRLSRLIGNLQGERKRLRATETELAHQALHDALTGLPNRALLLRRLELEIAAAETGTALAVLFLDLDNFKFVNDSLGHRAGDDLLRAAGVRIVNAVRGEDLVARIGGDEFVIVAPGIEGVAEATALAERVVATLSTPFELDGDLGYVTASVGIALRTDGVDPGALVRDADVALYHAKAGGGGTSRVFDETMRAWAEERHEIELGLRIALERDELAIVYQPRVDLATGSIRGVEALLRWPGHEDLPVGRVIEIAELTGLIGQIGDWVLRRACLDIVTLNALRLDGPPIWVSVNVSPFQLTRPTLAEEVGDALGDSAIDPAWVVLELTETFLAEEPERAVEELSALRDLGVRIEIDDFGIGHSSLARLGQFPLDGLKIDRSFVAPLDGSGRAELIVTAIIGLARALGLRVTAEGIETPAQARCLARLGCDLGQGFAFARPLPLDDVARLISSGATLQPHREPADVPGAMMV
jgi:diguanylate cyclase (GGDEF)-like protein